jgi:hypothetical protein
VSPPHGNRPSAAKSQHFPTPDGPDLPAAHGPIHHVLARRAKRK